MAIQLETNQLQDGLITTAKLGADCVDGTKIADDSIDSEHLAAGGIDSEHFSAGAVDETALGSGSVAFGKLKSADIETTLTGSSSKIPRADAVKNYVDAAAVGIEILGDVIDSVTAVTAPPSENEGDRYIITDSSTPNAGWDGVITGDGDIVQFASGFWTLATDVSADDASKALLTWNTTDGIWLKLDAGGTTWTEHGGLAGVTAGAGLTKTGNTIDANVDNSSIEVSGDALQVKALGIATGMLAADAVDGTKLADNAVDSEHITNGSVDNAHLAGSITAEKLNKTARIIDNVGSLDIGAGVVATSHLADDSVTADKVGFSSEWDVLSPDGVATAFDLSQTVNAAFEKMLVIRGGAVQKQVAASPADDSEYTVNLTGGAGGKTRITFGSAPANGVDLRVWFMY